MLYAPFLRRTLARTVAPFIALCGILGALHSTAHPATPLRGTAPRGTAPHTAARTPGTTVVIARLGARS